MKKISGETDKKTWLAVAAVAAAIAAVSGSVLLTRPSEAADKEALKKQRVAAGMPDMGAMRDRMLDQMGKELGLSNQQKQQFKDADEKMGPRMGKVFGDKSLSQEQRMQKMQQAGAEHDAEIKSILTADQQTKYQQMQERMRKQFQGRPGGLGPPPGGPNSGGPMPPPGGGNPGGPPPGGFGAPPGGKL